MYAFPSAVFPAGTFQFWLANTSVGGGSTLNGIGQEADWSGGGYWAGQITNLRVVSAAEHLAWRAFCVHVRGRLSELEMPVTDQFTWPVGNATPETMEFQVNATAALSATSIDIKVIEGGPLQGGEYFTIVHPTAGARLYCIDTVTQIAGGIQTCTFMPPLREAALANTPIDFQNPRCVMKVVSAAKDLWPNIQPPYKASPQAAFVESFSYQDQLA